MSLDSVAIAYGTDKSSQYHGYAAIYEQEIDTTRKDGSLLELGWLDGASMRMWRDWLPLLAWRITGLDIEPKEPVHGVQFVQGSQDDPEVIEHAVTVGGPFDVIIDDASHESRRTIDSFRLLWPHLKPGGLYFIEDLRTSYIAHWNQHGGPTIMEFLKSLTDDVHHHERWAVQHIAFWESLCMIKKEGG